MCPGTPSGCARAGVQSLTLNSMSRNAGRPKMAPLPPDVDDGRFDGVESGAVRVPSVTRAAAVLNVVAATHEGVSLSDLARVVKAPKSSVLSVCLALTDERLLCRNDDGHYRLPTCQAETVPVISKS